MRKAVLYFILSFIVSISAKAQAPGYMGRNLLIGIHAGVSPAMGLLSKGYNVKGTIAPTYLNISYGGFLEYATSRKSSVGLVYSYLKNGIETQVQKPDADYTNCLLPITTHYGALRLTGYLKKSSLGAPMGYWFATEWGISVSSLNDTYGYLNRGSNTLPYIGKYLTTILPQMHLAFGYRRGLGERLALSTSLNFSMAGLFVGVFRKQPYDGAIEYNDLGSQNILRRILVDRALLQNVVSLNIALAFVSK